MKSVDNSVDTRSDENRLSLLQAGMYFSASYPSMTFSHSGQHGDEYSGSCPACGGKDRFIVNDLGFWCRQCRITGRDIFDLFRVLKGLDAHAVALKILKLKDPVSALMHRRASSPSKRGYAPRVFDPKVAEAPPQAWQDSVRGILAEAIERLWDVPRVLDYLRIDRGLYPHTIEQAGIGFHTGNTIALPTGIFIPHTREDIIYSVKVREFGKYGKYTSIKGSKPVPLILCDPTCHIYQCLVVESEFDGLLLAQYILDAELPCVVVALGGRSLGYDLHTHKLLQESEKIFILLDNDQAGEISADLLVRRYAQSHKITLPIGKDPGEAYQKGLDLEQWAIDLLS